MNLTIVTAFWNACYIPKVIESVGNQTFKDWHHIMINDNNPEVREELPKYCNDTNRFWVDFNVRTHYYGALARNCGVNMAFSYVHHSKRDIDNEWIVFHDEDNLWEPNHLELMIEAIKANPNASMIMSDARWVGHNDKSWSEIKPCKLKHGSVDLGQVMYKTKLFKEYGYFDPHPRSKHKYDWRLINKMICGEGEIEGRIVFTCEPTFIMNYKKK